MVVMGRMAVLSCCGVLSPPAAFGSTAGPLAAHQRAMCSAAISAGLKPVTTLWLQSSLPPSSSSRRVFPPGGHFNLGRTYHGYRRRNGSTAVEDDIRGPKQIRSVTSASLGGPTTVDVAANVFQLATAFVIPFYTVMIVAPRWEWTKKVMESEFTYFLLGAGYIYLLCLSWTPETLGLMFSSKYWLPELTGIARMFTSTLTVASAWLHLLAADLFAGRQIFLDGLKHDVETRHSLVLCLMMCPIGIFSHLVTKSFILFSRRAGKQGDMEITSDFPSYRT